MTKHNVPSTFNARHYLKLKLIPMWLTLGILRLISFLPYSVLLQLGRSLGFVLKLITPKRQNIIDTNLLLCFPDKSDEERALIARESYNSLGITLVEYAICWWWPDKKLKSFVEIRGFEHVTNCLNNNQGVILVTGHFTSLELGARLLTLFMPIQVMYRQQRNELFNDFQLHKRNGYFKETISRKNMRKMIKGIKYLTPTWYAPDQDFGTENNVFAPFFGTPAATITATARLAKSTKAAVLPYFPERKKDGSGYILHISPAIQNMPSDSDLNDATAINQSIENGIKCRPEQYMWVHKRFKTRPEGEPPIY